MEDIMDTLLIESSHLQIKNMLDVLEFQDENNSNSRENVLLFTSQIFQFFFQQLRINLSFHQAQSYSDFILSEVFKKLKNIPLQEV